MSFDFSEHHRRRTCDGNLPNSLRPISYLGIIWDLYVLGLKFKVFCKNNNQVLKIMDKGLTVWPKIPKMPLHFSAKFVCPSPKVWDSQEKALSGCPFVVMPKKVKKDRNKRITIENKVKYQFCILFFLFDQEVITSHWIC